AGAPPARANGAPVRYDSSPLTNDDLFLFNEGSHFRLYEKLGAHPYTVGGVSGTAFAVWAPSADRVTVIGDFNGWNKDRHPLRPRENSGIWEGFVPGIGKGDSYKFHVVARGNPHRADKADPFGFFSEVPPKTASRVWDLEYAWGDGDWMAHRHQKNA